MPVLILFPNGRHQRPSHKEQPQDQTHKQERLPESSEINIFVPLVPEIEILHKAQLLHDSHPLSCKRPHDYHQQSNKQEIHSQSLVFWLLAGYSRGNEQPCGQPGGGNPENGKLYMPGP